MLVHLGKRIFYYARLYVPLAIILIAIISPRLFLQTTNYLFNHSLPFENHHFKLGLENITDEFLARITGNFSRTIGLITNQSGVDQKGNRNSDLLLAKGALLGAIITPNADVSGTNSQSANLYTYKDKHIKCDTFYRNGQLHTINDSTFKNIDILFFDIQDIGIGAYSYVTLLFDTLSFAHAAHKTVVVLDRPNLLGSSMEGCLGTLVKGKAIPLRYGMTMGELAHYFNKTIFEESLDLHVVPMTDYNRVVPLQALKSNVSCAINSLESCFGYSFLGLLAEVAPFDVGLGTTFAFQCILLPEEIAIPRQKWFELRSILYELGIESAFYRSTNEEKNQALSGLTITIKDINKISTIKTVITILSFFKKQGLTLTFSSRFDQLIGNTKIRDYIEERIDYPALVRHNNRELRQFFNNALYSFIYQPLPQLVMV